MRKLNWDLLQLQKGSRDGSHGTRRERSYALAQMANTLHEEGYRGLRARNLKGRHVEALVREWFRRGLSHATMNPSRPLGKNLFHQYVEGQPHRPVTTSVRTRHRCARVKGSWSTPAIRG